MRTWKDMDTVHRGQLITTAAGVQIQSGPINAVSQPRPTHLSHSICPGRQITLQNYCHIIASEVSDSNYLIKIGIHLAGFKIFADASYYLTRPGSPSAVAAFHVCVLKNEQIRSKLAEHQQMFIEYIFTQKWYWCWWPSLVNYCILLFTEYVFNVDKKFNEAV